MQLQVADRWSFVTSLTHCSLSQLIKFQESKTGTDKFLKRPCLILFVCSIRDQLAFLSIVSRISGSRNSTVCFNVFGMWRRPLFGAGADPRGQKNTEGRCKAPTPNLFLLLPSCSVSVGEAHDKLGCWCCFSGPAGFAGCCWWSLAWQSHTRLWNHFLQTDFYVICFFTRLSTCVRLLNAQFLTCVSI